MDSAGSCYSVTTLDMEPPTGRTTGDGKNNDPPCVLTPPLDTSPSRCAATIFRSLGKDVSQALLVMSLFFKALMPSAFKHVVVEDGLVHKERNPINMYIIYNSRARRMDPQGHKFPQSSTPTWCHTGPWRDTLFTFCSLSSLT